MTTPTRSASVSAAITALEPPLGHAAGLPHRPAAHASPTCDVPELERDRDGLVARRNLKLAKVKVDADSRLVHLAKAVCDRAASTRRGGEEFQSWRVRSRLSISRRRRKETAGRRMRSCAQ
jgi:hypothetical protein